MIRFLALLVAFFACVSLRNSVAAPIPPGDAKPLYYPTAVGTKWVWEFSSGGTRTLMVAAVKDEKDAKIVTVDEVKEDGTTTYYMTMKVSSAGLFEVDTRVCGRDSPLCLLKLPHKDGASWEVESKIEMKLGPGRPLSATEKWKFTATGPEEVKVPAGTFNAIRVKSVEGRQETTYWYAPGVGMVKLEYEEQLGGKRPTIQTTVLKSFTPPKQ